MGATDLGGASPIWMFILLAIVGGPFVWAIVYGLRHRDSGAPKDEGTLEAPEMMKSLKDWIDTRTGGQGLLGVERSPPPDPGRVVVEARVRPRP